MFGGVFAHGAVAEQVSDRAWLQAMLDVEAALARASARVGVVPSDAAEAIAAVCDASRFDVDAIGREAAASSNPVIPLVRSLRAVVGSDAAQHVHRGATSQDVLDTAAVLLARRALDPLLADAAFAAGALAGLASRHGDTVMLGRTLMQPALPITFALKAAGWLVALDDARRSLGAVARGACAVQLGGAVGTLAAFGGARGLEVHAALADELGLAEPVAPWHTSRVRVARLAGALATLAGVEEKIARDVVLLAQGEVAEVRSGAGGSSTMPHKRNPVAAVSAVACCTRVPGLAATLLSAMPQEHERGAGAWQAEWEPFAELLRLVGSATAWTRELLGDLEVDVERMRANLDAAGPGVMAESVVTALSDRLGWGRAQEVVRSATAAAGAGSFRDALLARDDVREALGSDGVDAALNPAGYLGASAQLVARVLEAHSEEAGA